MRLLRTLLIACVLVLGVLAAAAWLVPPRLDVNAWRDEIAALASARLGRSVRIDGPIAFRLLPEPTLTAARVSFAAPSAGISITAAELSLRLALGPLFAGRVDARELVLRGAELRVPWPLAPPTLRFRTPRWLAAFSARVEGGRVVIGRLAVTGIDGTLATDRYTGTYRAAGTATFSAMPWRFTARLSQPGQDGSAGLDVTLDGQDRAQGAGGTLSGQFAPDGAFTGRVAARGPDLARLLPAPAMPFSAEGRVTAAGGLAAADDLVLRLGGSPARAAVALRVAPSLRLDLAVAASRLDLDAWLPVLMRPAATGLPTGIDLSAEAASLAGGTLRGLRAAVDLTPDAATVREARAVLPGDATLRLAGRVLPGTAASPGPHFDGDVTFVAPALRTTLAWAEKAGLVPRVALPAGVLHGATLAAHVAADSMQMAASKLDGRIDGSHVTGSMTLHRGARFAIGAGLAVDRLDLDSWLPGPSPGLAALPGWFRGFDLNLRLDAREAVLRGLVLAPLALDAGAEDGRLSVRKLELGMGGAHASASATVAADGHVSEGRLDVQAPHAVALAPLLPDRLAFLARRVPALWQAAAAVQVLGGGAPNALALKVTADLDDARLEGQPILDLRAGTWKAGMTLRHPGAPRLLQELDMPAVASWLGDGSLGLVAQLSGAAGRLAADSFDLSAGGLHATGALLLDRGSDVPLLTGHVAADTLPLPAPQPRATAPLPLAALAGWSASVQLTAAHVLADQRPVLDQAAAMLGLAQGVLRIDGLTGTFAGGTLHAAGLLDTAAEPPAATLHFDLIGAAVTEPAFDLPLDLAGGFINAHADLTAAGHAPATLMATLGGAVTLDASHGTLAGVALDRLAGDLGDAAVAAALAGGSTPFATLHVVAAADHGVVTMRQGTLALSDGGSATLGGSIDLPDGTLALTLTAHPAGPDAPAIGLRLSGPAAAATRTPELADLTRWRAAQAEAAVP